MTRPGIEPDHWRTLSIIARMKFELLYFEAAFQHLNHYTTRTPQRERERKRERKREREREREREIEIRTTSFISEYRIITCVHHVLIFLGGVSCL